VKGQVIAALIDLSKRRKYAKSLASAVAGHLAKGERKAAADGFVRYHVEVDNVLVDFTRILRKLVQDADAHRRGHRDLGRAIAAEPAPWPDYAHPKRGHPP